MRIHTNLAEGPILVGIDFSPASQAVVEYAAGLARAESKPLYVVYVMPIIPEDNAPLLDVQEAELKLHVEKAKQALRDSGVTVKGMLAVGNAAHKLINLADKLNAACIVVGTEGLRGLDRFLLGSVAETVIRKSDRPVIVVGPQAAKETAKTLPWKHLMLACDTAHGVTEVSRLAGNIAVTHHARLTIFHVKEAGLQHLTEDEFTTMETMMSPEMWLTVKPQCLIRVGEPAQEIIRMAQDSHADLLVMSVQSGGEMLTRLRGGIIAEVLRMARCPVLILRDGNDRQSHSRREQSMSHSIAVA